MRSQLAMIPGSGGAMRRGRISCDAMTEAPRSGLALDELSAEIRPQDDLFRHVNGAWLDRTEIPDDKARWGSFHLIAEQAEKDVRAIVEESQDAEPGTESRKIGDLYTSFMDTDRIAEPRVPLRSPSSSPPSTRSTRSRRCCAPSANSSATGSAGSRSCTSSPTRATRPRYVPFLMQGGLSLPDESYYRLENFGETRIVFRGHVERMLELAGRRRAPRPRPTASSALETELATHHWDNVRSRDAVATYNLKSWDEVQALAGVDLGPWLEGLRAGPRRRVRRGRRQPAELRRRSRHLLVAGASRRVEGLAALLDRARRGRPSCRTTSSMRTSRSTARSSPACR